MERRLRLRHPREFARLRHEGKVLHHPFFLFSYAPNGLTHNRYGFVVARRHGKAVQRNRIKRLLREASRLLHPQLHQGYDLVFVARAHIAGQPFFSVQRNMLQVLEQAGLVREDGD